MAPITYDVEVHWIGLAGYRCEDDHVGEGEEGGDGGVSVGGWGGKCEFVVVQLKSGTWELLVRNWRRRERKGEGKDLQNTNAKGTTILPLWFPGPGYTRPGEGFQTRV
jgi:hypothetical protein